MGRRTLARVLATIVALSGIAVPAAAMAQAKSFWIAEADVEAVVNDDGALDVTERITFDFSGSFTGAYRDIPLRPGESLGAIVVSDSSGPYTPGGCIELGCFSPAGTYGVAVFPTFVRVVWHHNTTNRLATFTLSYTMRGLVTAYDDVVDVNLQVWGDQWAVGVDRLTATVILPGSSEPGEVLVWGHPFGIDGSTSLGEDGISPSLEASDVPPERWVEIRTTFPTDLLSSTDGARRVAGNGLDSILEEERQFALDNEAAR
ncbi:MAG: DUF2207 domain-containing protein, partial [Acidimicrobiia bacterium]